MNMLAQNNNNNNHNNDDDNERRGEMSTLSDKVGEWRRVTYGSRAFSVAGPVCWNRLPDYLKSPELSFDCFKRQLKIFLFCAY